MAKLLRLTKEGLQSFAIPNRSPNRSPGVGLPEKAFSMIPVRDGSRPRHALIATTETPIRVNGSPLIGGFRVLEHKDELLIGSQQVFFSAESVPQAEVYQHQGDARRPRCPVCRGEIQDAQTVVRCPGCTRVFHHNEAAAETPAIRGCWTYAPACRFCEHPTSMTEEAMWRPDQDDLA